jgi:hypothetical protein
VSHSVFWNLFRRFAASAKKEAKILHLRERNGGNKSQTLRVAEASSVTHPSSCLVELIVGMHRYRLFVIGLTCRKRTYPELSRFHPDSLPGPS